MLIHKHGDHIKFEVLINNKNYEEEVKKMIEKYKKISKKYEENKGKY